MIGHAATPEWMKGLADTIPDRRRGSSGEVGSGEVESSDHARQEGFSRPGVREYLVECR
ncbi:hypothetical protein BN2475_460013 [Paraburkholderia ribeironis]|uniref:Uncharacterized protein n=1 Tax=Paraburkholderia ribeironis TaxID=1247936 RepID=A0A1N7S9J7_9BURK|nr:hypothetical protein BN2475_460013 [Paraburkholderia ribeironis]